MRCRDFSTTTVQYMYHFEIESRIESHFSLFFFRLRPASNTQQVPTTNTMRCCRLSKTSFLFRLRVYCSLVILTGISSLLMGLGIMDVNPNLAVAAGTVLGFLPHRLFYLFLGLSKIYGVLGLWGHGEFSWKLSFVALGTPATCAVYAHTLLEEGLPAVFAGSNVVGLALLYLFDTPPGGNSSPGKKNGVLDKENS